MDCLIKRDFVRLLNNREFAASDTGAGWRFVDQGAHSGSSIELPVTPTRLACVPDAERLVHLYQMPDAFKSGFVRGFYGTARTNDPNASVRDNKETLLNHALDLNRLLFTIGRKAGYRQLMEQTFAPSHLCDPFSTVPILT